MILRKADPKTEAGGLPSPELLAAMGKYVESMGAAGILLGGDGLRRSATGKRITFRGGKSVVTDGPFAETKELLAGYLLIRVDSMDDALEWAKRWPPMDVHGELELEIR